MHRIRLRSAWVREQASASSARWSRWFHRPSGLSSEDRIYVAIRDADPPIDSVWIGDHELSALERSFDDDGEPMWLFQVSLEALELRNRLCLQCPSSATDPPSCELWIDSSP